MKISKNMWGRLHPAYHVLIRLASAPTGYVITDKDAQEMDLAASQLVNLENDFSGIIEHERCDLFAAHALQGILASGKYYGGPEEAAKKAREHAKCMVTYLW